MALVNSDSSDDSIKLFEYNSYPLDQVQNAWFTTWVAQTQVEFDLKMERFRDKPNVVQHLAQLFKESYEVGI